MTFYWYDVRYWLVRTAAVCSVAGLFVGAFWMVTGNMVLSAVAGTGHYAIVYLVMHVLLVRSDEREARRAWRHLRRLAGRFRDKETISVDAGKITLQCRRRGFRGFVRIRADGVEPSLVQQDRVIVPVELFLLAPTGRVLRWADAWPAIVARNGRISLDVERIASDRAGCEPDRAAIRMMAEVDMLATTSAQVRELIEQVERAKPVG